MFLAKFSYLAISNLASLLPLRQAALSPPVTLLQGKVLPRQAARHSVRHRSPQASQGNSAASQADSTSSWEGTHPLPPQIGFPKGLPWKIPTQSGSSTYPANL